MNKSSLKTEDIENKMTLQEAKQIFLNKIVDDATIDPDIWEDACGVMIEWLKSTVASSYNDK